MRTVAAKKEKAQLPELQARMLAALCESFFAQPGMEEEYQQWLTEKKPATKKKAREKAG
jgi:lipase chaperone LimK